MSTIAVQAFEATSAALAHRFRLERTLAASEERALFVAHDKLLKRSVSLRVHCMPNSPSRAWFWRHAETLAQLDHRAIRHVYDAGSVEPLAYRVGNWIQGESLSSAVARGPRPIPTVHRIARRLLGAVQHAHDQGIVIRRIVPSSVLISPAGLATISDLRFSSPVLEAIPPDVSPSFPEFMAPEIRGADPGDPSADVYAAGAILYLALTGSHPPLDPSDLVPPREIRPVCPRVLNDVLLRALQPSPADRFYTVADMLEAFTADAGAFDTGWYSGEANRILEADDPSLWEQRLRRALGDDYELLGMLGSGGFGRVYRVRDLHLEREVALKVLHPIHTEDPDWVERFRREAQLAAGLNHPNIVDIFDIAVRSGLMWYTMELVRGPNVAQLVESEGPLPLDRLLGLLREALSALAHAHRSGLVHRDIKPENLLIDSDGALRITDFGLAMALAGHGSFGGATSRSGTPQFASPEQLLGERVDQRTDLYSLAAVAYFAILGHASFSGATPEQILASQTAEHLPPLVSVRPEVTRDLERVLSRALRSDPSKRYDTAVDFAEALRDAIRSRGLAGGVTSGWWKRP